MFRAMERGASTHWRRRVSEVASELGKGTLDVVQGRAALLASRKEVVRGYSEIKVALEHQGERELAEQVGRFVEALPPAQTEKEWIAALILDRTRECQKFRV